MQEGVTHVRYTAAKQAAICAIALHAADGDVRCFRCFPMRPWPAETWPRFFLFLCKRVGILMYYGLTRPEPPLRAGDRCGLAQWRSLPQRDVSVSAARGTRYARPVAYVVVFPRLGSDI